MVSNQSYLHNCGFLKITFGSYVTHKQGSSNTTTIACDVTNNKRDLKFLYWLVAERSNNLANVVLF